MLRSGIEFARTSTRSAQRIQWRRRRQAEIAAYLNDTEVPRMQLGSGPSLHPGWLNTDLAPQPGAVFLDVTETFPLRDSSLQLIHSEHHIEHLTYADGVHMLTECFRVLQAGGTLRLATPDLDKLLALRRKRLSADQKHYLRWMGERFLPDVPAEPIFVINNALRAWGHQFLYDETTLRQVLSDIGFVNISVKPVGDSDHPLLQGIETHGVHVQDERVNAYETLVLEATTPTGAM